MIISFTSNAMSVCLFEHFEHTDTVIHTLLPMDLSIQTHKNTYKHIQTDIQTYTYTAPNGSQRSQSRTIIAMKSISRVCLIFYLTFEMIRKRCLRMRRSRPGEYSDKK